MAAVRDVLAETRRVVLAHPDPGECVRGFLADGFAILLDRIEAYLQREDAPRLQRVINATGIVLHTNLGRAPLAAGALEALSRTAGGYCNLEYHTPSGRRGDRSAALEERLCRLTNAEGALVVNNNAAAVLLALATLAGGREVIVSRGEMVEIGGSFRIPDVMALSGARLREVGTTNKTRISDYEAAIGDTTALLLKVHTSNYRIVGFTASVPIEEIVELGARHGIPVMEDLGSGAFFDLSPFGLPGEPQVAQRIARGVDIVTMSGDKLLGGPQAGILLGRRRFIAAMRKNPLYRALRVGKLTIAALEATLRDLSSTERAWTRIPVLRMLTLPKETLRARAEALRAELLRRIPQGLHVTVIEGDSEAGGGALPTVKLPTYLVALRSERLSPVELERLLRLGDPPIIARISHDRLLLDPRTLFEDDPPIIVDRLSKGMNR